MSRTDGASEHFSGCGERKASKLIPFQPGRDLTQASRWVLVKWEVLMDLPSLIPTVFSIEHQLGKALIFTRSQKQTPAFH